MGDAGRTEANATHSLRWFVFWAATTAFCICAFAAFWFALVGYLAGCLALIIASTNAYRLPAPLGVIAGIGIAVVALEFLSDRGCGLDNRCEPRALPLAIGLAAIAVSAGLAGRVATHR